MFEFVGPRPSNKLYTQDVVVVDIGGMYYLRNPEQGANFELSATP